MLLKNVVLSSAILLLCLPSVSQASNYVVMVKEADAAKWDGKKPYAAIALTRRFERMTVREAEVNGRNVLLVTVTHVMPAHPLASKPFATIGREIKKTCETDAGELCIVNDEEGVEIVRIKRVS